MTRLLLNNLFKFKTKYNLRVADIFKKAEKTFVLFQCAHTNNFVRYRLELILNNEHILEQISPKTVKLLTEISLEQKNKQRIALTDDGAFVYDNSSECFYSTEELLEMTKHNQFLKKLCSTDSFLLGYQVGLKEKNKIRQDSKLYLVK